MKKFLAFSITMILMLAILLSTFKSTWAAANKLASSGNTPVVPSQQQGPRDPAELEAFLDELLGRELAENHIAGAAVSVVKDGKLFFAKGYGYADLEEGIPVDPEQTLFRIGSVSKLFAWTAVMQLVEQGKLDLDADVNAYLDLRIPATYPQPITLKHLMTHTSGFEEVLLGSVVSDPDDLMPVRAWLIAHMPARVHPPGDYVGYANYNAALAGYIVARVSGQPYDQYVQEHILAPLGMVHSTAQSPLPSELRGYASVGYAYAESAFREFPVYLIQSAVAPSGGIQASAMDMARFMNAYLPGSHDSGATEAAARILQESTVQQMLSTLYTPDPRLRGIAYGFFDLSDNGQRTLGSEGYYPPMHSQLLLLPEQNLGVFVTYNSEDAGELTTQHVGFQRAFFDHYYPAPAVAPIQPPADFAERAGRFVGTYRVASSPHTTLIKIVELFGAYRARISDPGDGTLLLSAAGLDLRFAEVAPLYFQQVDGPFAMVFCEDDSGHITDMYTDLMPQYSTVKLGWYETTGFNVALALGCVVLFLSVIPVAAISFIRNRRLRGDRTSKSDGARVAHGIIVSICVLNLLFLVGTVLWGQPPTELGSISLMAKLALGLGVLAAVLTVGALIYTVLVWKNHYWGRAARAYYTLLTVAAVAFVWFLDYWKLLGWRY